MQPFRGDDEIVRARVRELEEELSGLRSRLAHAHAPEARRLDQLEHAIESERQLLAVARMQLVRRHTYPTLVGFPIVLAMVVLFFLMRSC